MKKYITTKELAKMLQVAEITIFRWRQRGLPHIKVGRSIRYDFDEVMKWIEKNNQKEVM